MFSKGCPLGTSESLLGGQAQNRLMDVRSFWASGVLRSEGHLTSLFLCSQEPSSFSHGAEQNYSILTDPNTVCFSLPEEEPEPAITSRGNVYWETMTT